MTPPAALKDGVCPRCDGTQILAGTDLPDKSGDGGGNRLPLNAVFAVPLDNFVCAACGYLESYILDRSILNRIAREWARVPVQPPEA